MAYTFTDEGLRLDEIFSGNGIYSSLVHVTDVCAESNLRSSAEHRNTWKTLFGIRDGLNLKEGINRLQIVLRRCQPMSSLSGDHFETRKFNCQKKIALYSILYLDFLDFFTEDDHYYRFQLVATFFHRESIAYLLVRSL